MFIAAIALFAFALAFEVIGKKVLQKLFPINKGQIEQQPKTLTVMAQTFRKKSNKSQDK